jgi:hypothetical protein
MYLITVPTKKTIISSATFLGYCVGNMAGSQIFKEADAPRYSKSMSEYHIKLGS